MRSDDNNIPLSEQDLTIVYKYVDQVPTNKAKKNFARDYCDCCQVAVLVKHYLPKGHKNLCHPHNYIESMNKKKKLDNWTRLNQQVMKKLVGDKHPLLLTNDEINNCIDCVPFAMERTLLKIK